MLQVESKHSVPAPAVGFHSYAWNTTVTALVNPAVLLGGGTKYTCTGWIGTGSIVSSSGASSTGPIVLNELDSSITWLWATNFWLGAAASPNGSIDQASRWLAPAAELTITATPSPHCHFVGWTGDTDGALIDGACISLTMDKPRSVTAVFAVDSYTLIYLANQGGLLDGVTTQLVEHGATSTPVTAIPLTGYHFVSWSDGTQSAQRQDANVTNAMTVTAQYAINQYSLNYTATPGGTLAGMTNQTVAYGFDASPVTAVPLTGYRFLGWSDGNLAAMRQDICLTGNVAVTATFVPGQYLVSFDAVGGDVHPPETNVTFDAAYGYLPVPVRPYHCFAGWWIDQAGTDAQVTAESLVSIASNHTLYAKWTPFPSITGTISYTGGRTGMIHVLAQPLAPPIVPDFGLVASYSFNGNANDASDYANHGTVHGAVLTTDRFGMPDRAYRFNGVSDYIACPSPVDDFQQGMTVSCWIKMPTILAHFQTAVCKPRPRGDMGGISLNVFKGIGESFFNNDPWSDTPGAVDFTLKSLSPVEADKWHHLVATLDGGTMRFYVDGMFSGEQAYSDNGLTSAVALQIGRAGSEGSYFTGSIDDVNVYDRALSTEEVSMLHHATAYQVCIPEPGLYVISNMISDVTYSISAYMDSNGNGILDDNERNGSYMLNPLYLTNTVTGIDIDFGLETLQVAVTASSGGSVVPSGTIPVAYGASTNITILPALNYYVADVLVNGVSVGPVSEFLFANVTSNQSLHAIFARYPYTYIIADGKATITGYTGPGGAIVIPDTLAGFPVTVIGVAVFQGCTSLTSIIIPDGVTTIGDFAFDNCTALASVTIPDSVTRIGWQAFSGCTALTSVTIPPNATIGGSAFSGCTALTSVTIPPNATIKGDGTFNSCTSLTNVTICKGVTYIGFAAFHNCTSLTSVTIPDSVTFIHMNAFSSCTSLTNVTIPDSVTGISSSTFYSCTSLTSVTIPNRVRGIGDNAFNNCTALTNITIPASVISIGPSAFNNCTALTSITIPASVTTICESTFQNCTSLTSLTIPASVTTIEPYAFRSCTSLTRVYFTGHPPYPGYGIFLDSPATLYYLPAYASSWPSTYADRPTTLWPSITSTADPSGSVYPEGLILLEYGASTNITILPAPHHHVADVLVNGVSVGPVNEYSFVNVTSNLTLHALFAADELSLTVTSAHGGACPGSLTAGYGSELLLAITNSQIYNGWTQYSCTGATVSGNSFTLLAPTNVILTLTNNATLTWLWQARYLLAANAGEGGSISGAGWYAAGTEVTLTATPDEHFQFVQWNDGALSATRAVTVPEGGIGFVALFAPISRGVFRFQKPVYSVAEDAAVAILKVERADGSYGAASVTYTVQDGSATADEDYAASPSTFNWADGQAGAKSIYILILDDAIIEGNEAFTVHLANPSGASLGSPVTATVSIVDDEAAPSSIIRLSGDLAFGAVPTNAPASRTLEVWNDGNETLSITNISLPAAFSVDQQTFDVAAGEMYPLSVSFAPTALIAYEGILVLGCDATSGTASMAVSGTGTLSGLPAGFRTISGLTAVIAVDVPPGAEVLGVEDELSPGQIPLSISDDGTWDAVNRKVKWFFNQSGQVRDRALQYRVNTVGMVVSGAVNFGAGNLPITGDTLFESSGDPGLLHPADDNGDWRIVLSEVSASVSRWRNGLDDQSTPVVIRGITLYLEGEQYAYDPEIGSVAKRWIPILSPLSMSLNTLSDTLMRPLSELPVGAVRSVDATNVTVSVTPATDTTAWGVEEAIPEGMQVVFMGADGTWDANHRKIKWEFRNASPRIISYRLSGEPGTIATVTGYVSFDGSKDPVSGPAIVAAPLPFMTWAERNGISGTQTEAFQALNAVYGQPNGLVYACQSNLDPDDQLLVIRFVNGLPVLEIPLQDPSTLPYVNLHLEGTSDLTSGSWPLTFNPAPDNSGTPPNRQRLVPDQPPPSGFFRLKAAFK